MTVCYHWCYHWCVKWNAWVGGPSAPAPPNNASSMLSMINMNNVMHEAANRQNPFHLLGSSTGPLSALHSMADLKVNTGVSPSSISSCPSTPITAALLRPSSSPFPPPLPHRLLQPSVRRQHHRPLRELLITSTTSWVVRRRPPSRPLRLSLNTALAGALPRFSLPAAVQGMYFNSTNGLSHKLATSFGDLSGRHLYWPSMVQNQALWRERLAGAGMTVWLVCDQWIVWLIGCLVCIVSQQCLDKDGKKKHTRPTFSGHQIYVLEKTFEQTK